MVNRLLYSLVGFRIVGVGVVSRQSALEWVSNRERSNMIHDMIYADHRLLSEKQTSAVIDLFMNWLHKREPEKLCQAGLDMGSSQSHNSLLVLGCFLNNLI